MAVRGAARLGTARHGTAGTAWHGVAGRGLAGSKNGPPLWDQRRAGGIRDLMVAQARGAYQERDSQPDMTEMKIDKIPAATIFVPIVGTTPLIVHRFSEKAKREMLDREQGRGKVREIRDPEADFQDSLYRLDSGGYGFPALAFKAATVSAARFYGKSVTMIGLRQCLFFHGEYSKTVGQSLVEIEGTPVLREDYVRFGMGSTDLRYRGEFTEWRAVLRVAYVTSSLAQSSVLSLIDAGGMGVGVGEWRPLSKHSSGEFGTYAIDPTRPVEVAR